MNRPSRTILIVALLAVLAVPALVFATAPATSGDTTPPAAGGHHFHAHGAMSMFKQLNLTSDQKAKIKSIMASHSDAMKTSFTQLRTAKTALTTAIHADKFDEGAIRAASQSMAAIQEEMNVMRAQLVNEIRPVLTPDQVAKAKQLQAQYEAKSQARAAAREQHEHATPPSQ